MDGDKYDCDTSAGQKMLVDIRENKIPGLDHFISNDKEHALHKVSTSGYGGCSAVCASAMIHTMPRMISQRTTRSVYLGCQQLV